MSEARIWYLRDPDQKLMPGDCQNVIGLSDEFYREILTHPIPAYLAAAKAPSSSPAALGPLRGRMEFRIDRNNYFQVLDRI